jgi:hypothetical protein
MSTISNVRHFLQSHPPGGEDDDDDDGVLKAKYRSPVKKSSVLI